MVRFKLKAPNFSRPNFALPKFGRENNAKVHDDAFARPETIMEKIKAWPFWYWIVGLMVLAGTIIMCVISIPAMALSLTQSRMEQNFCTVQPGSDPDTGCVRVALQQSPGGTRCIYHVPGESGSGTEKQRRMNIIQHLEYSEVPCYYPEGNPDLIQFNPPTSYSGTVFYTFALSLVLFLAAYLVAYTCIRLAPSKDDWHDPEAAMGLMAEMEKRVQRSIKENNTTMREEISALQAKVDRDQDKRLQLQNELMDVRSQQRAVASQPPRRNTSGGRRLAAAMENELEAANEVLERVERKTKARGGRRSTSTPTKSASKRGNLRGARAGDKFKRPDHPSGWD